MFIVCNFVSLCKNLPYLCDVNYQCIIYNFFRSYVVLFNLLFFSFSIVYLYFFSLIDYVDYRIIMNSLHDEIIFLFHLRDRLFVINVYCVNANMTVYSTV